MAQTVDDNEVKYRLCRTVSVPSHLTSMPCGICPVLAASPPPHHPCCALLLSLASAGTQRTATVRLTPGPWFAGRQRLFTGWCDQPKLLRVHDQVA